MFVSELRRIFYLFSRNTVKIFVFPCLLSPSARQKYIFFQEDNIFCLCYILSFLFTKGLSMRAGLYKEKLCAARNKLPVIYIAKQIINIFLAHKKIGNISCICDILIQSWNVHLGRYGKNYYAQCHPQLINCLVKIINEIFFRVPLNIYMMLLFLFAIVVASQHDKPHCPTVCGIVNVIETTISFLSFFLYKNYNSKKEAKKWFLYPTTKVSCIGIKLRNLDLRQRYQFHLNIIGPVITKLIQ